MTSRARRAFTCLAVTAALALTGCSRGPQLGQVEGVVRAVDGKPLPNIFIQFMPDVLRETKGPRSSATTDAQGRYRLVLDDQREGAVVGWHKITLYDQQLRDVPQGTRPGPSRVPLSCSNPLSTPLEREVAPGPQTIDLNVPRGP